MLLTRAGAQPSIKGPADDFTGSVRIDPVNASPEPIRVSRAYVTFEPDGPLRLAHHPLRQNLLVTAGCGWAQCEGEPIVEIRAGDGIGCPPGHGQGATPIARTPIVTQKSLDGRAVDWVEKVTEEDYLMGLGAPPKAVPTRLARIIPEFL